MVRTRLTVWIVLLAIAALGFGLVSWPRDGGRALRAYASAPLLAHEGLGDLRVGGTTLAWFLERFGPGLPSALYGDATALEFSYAGTGLTFRFWLDEPCARTVQAMAGTGLRAVRDARRFGRAHPECADERLDGIEIDAGGSERTTFWRGETMGGVRLRMPRDEALERLADTSDGPRSTSFGVAPEAVEGEVVRFVDAGGLHVWFGPERGASAGDGWIVTRLAVAAPPAP